jgi:hypothetical protein
LQEEEAKTKVMKKPDVPLKIAWILFIAISLFATIQLITQCISYATFNMPLDDGEGFVLNQALYLARGANPYLPIDTPPYIVTNYPPVFIGVLAVLVKIFGASLTLGRMISIISGFLIIIIAFFACRPEGPKRMFLPSLIAPAIIAATPVMFFWFPLCRVDTFASLLSLAAVYIFWRCPDRKGLYLALPLLWLAVFTRQSAIEGFLVIAVILLLNRKKDFWRFVILYFAGAIVIFIICQAVFGAEFFKHLVTYTKTKWFLQRLIGTYQVIFKGMLLPTIISVYAATRIWKYEGVRIWVIYYIIGFLMSILIGKVGSAQNYMMPMFIPGAIIIGIWAAREYSGAKNNAALKPAIVVVMAVLIAYMGFATGDRQYAFKPNPATLQNGRQLTEIIGSFKGPVFIEDEGLTLLSGKDVVYTPFIMNQLYKDGIWDQTPFVESLRRADYELIVLRFDIFDPDHEDIAGLGDMAGWDRFSPEMEDAIRQNYEHYVSDGTPVYMRRFWYLYTPKKDNLSKLNLFYTD